jgi:hypothetical protein
MRGPANHSTATSRPAFGGTCRLFAKGALLRALCRSLASWDGRRVETLDPEQREVDATLVHRSRVVRCFRKSTTARRFPVGIRRNGSAARLPLSNHTRSGGVSSPRRPFVTGACPLRACLGRATQFVASYLHARCEGDEGQALQPRRACGEWSRNGRNSVTAWTSGIAAQGPALPKMSTRSWPTPSSTQWPLPRADCPALWHWFDDQIFLGSAWPVLLGSPLAKCPWTTLSLQAAHPFPGESDHPQHAPWVAVLAGRERRVEGLRQKARASAGCRSVRLPSRMR